MNISESSEEIIIERILKGETDLFKELIRKSNSVLYKVGRSYGYNHEDTQDLMQDAFVESFLSLNKFEKRSSYKTWVTRIMLNKCYKRSKKFSYQNELPDEISHDEKSNPLFSGNNTNDINNIIMNKELNRIIEDSMMQIALEYRMVFLLREINGMSVAETAEALNISESNVKVRLNRAKVMMRKEIEKTYSREEIFEFNLLYCDMMVDRVMSAIKMNRK